MYEEQGRCTHVVRIALCPPDAADNDLTESPFITMRIFFHPLILRKGFQ